MSAPAFTLPAPYLPMSRKEMQQLGWSECDVVLVTGDAYVDHPSFGMAIIGRWLEKQGLRIGIIAQPDWSNKEAFMTLGKPRLFFGVTAGNMDSMINRYTADKKLRHDDAYTPGNVGGKRPDRATLVYSQRCKEAYKEVPVILGGIEASLRRVAHFDYWSETVRRSVLFDAKADLLLFGNAERALVELVQRLEAGESMATLNNIRGTAVILKEPLADWRGVDHSQLEVSRDIPPLPNPYACHDESESCHSETAQPIQVQLPRLKPWEQCYLKLPSYEEVKGDKVLYAHASRLMHLENNPFSARALVQAHGDRLLWINPPAIPLETAEMDEVFALPFQRRPHPAYGQQKIPAFEMIKTSVNIMRGCFGGCSFCSIVEHEGKVIQSRSQASILQEIREIKEKVPGFTGVISDLGGPTANMYQLRCKSPKAEQSCRRASCLYPEICRHMDTDHTPTIELYRAARKIPGIKKILIASGVRYDLAVEDPRYVKELVTHHVGGYLKIAPEHTEPNALAAMMKPGMASYDRFKELFEKYSKEAGKEQFLIPYFIAAHPGCSDEEMVNLALWLKANRFKLDQVQNFYPSPLSNATTMYYSGKNPLHRVSREEGNIETAKGERHRRLHKALLRYHDPAGWPQIREALVAIGRSDLIGHSAKALVPPESREERSATKTNPRGSGKPEAKASYRNGSAASNRDRNGSSATNRGAASGNGAPRKPAARAPFSAKKGRPANSK